MILGRSPAGRMAFRTLPAIRDQNIMIVERSV